MRLTMGGKMKYSFYVIFFSIILISTATIVHADAVGGYTFSSDYVYYGEISSISVKLVSGGVFPISHSFDVDTNHVANLYSVTIDDSYPNWDNIILYLLIKDAHILFQIRVVLVGGGSDTIRGLTVPNEDFIPDKNVTITSITLDPSALILNSGYQTSGSVTWTAFGTPGTTTKYPSGYTPGTTTPTTASADPPLSTTDETLFSFNFIIIGMIFFGFLRIKKKK